MMRGQIDRPDMGWPSSHEHDHEKRDEAAFVEHEIADDLKQLLVAPVEPRTFKPRSKPAPKLKKSKELTTQQRKYRALQRAKKRAHRRSLPPKNEAVANARWHLQQLRLMLEKQAMSIGPGAPYHLISVTGDDALKCLSDIEAEIERLKIVLRSQHSLLKRGRRSGQLR